MGGESWEHLGHLELLIHFRKRKEKMETKETFQLSHYDASCKVIVAYCAGSHV